MFSTRPRYQQYVLVGAALAIFIFFYFTLHERPPTGPIYNHTEPLAWNKDENRPTLGQRPAETSSSQPHDALQCPHAPGADKILVVLKTGGTESQRRIPVHLRTDLRCVPHYKIYSDLAEEIEGVQIHDALAQVSDRYRTSHDDFEHYRLLAQYRREGKDISELVPAAGSVKEDTSAWKLDKWKFLPLVVKAVQDKPDADWYVFVEADIYLVWGTLQQYLARFESVKDQDWYIGGENWMANVEFGNGGSGYIMSRSAAHKFAELISSDLSKYEAMTEQNCCGDLLIAIVFLELGISLTKAWPILQGETPSTLDYTAHHWCHPVVTYHHMSGQEMHDYNAFEQSWLKSENASEAVMHRDAFTHFVEPHIQDSKQSWDNMSRDKTFHASTTNDEVSDIERAAHESVTSCANACLADQKCMQYSFKDEHCFHGHVIRLGHAVSQSQESGWMAQRILQFKQDQEPCLPRWILGNAD